MISVEEKLKIILMESLKNCTEFSSQINTKPKSTSVNLTLETEHGVLISNNNPKNTFTTIDSRNLLPVFIPKNEDEELFGMFYSSDKWVLLSSFNIDTMLFYTSLILKDPPCDNYALRFEIQAILDCFNKKCKKVLRNYIDTIRNQNQKCIDRKKLHKIEKYILDFISSYSHSIDCIALLDTDGFLLEYSGNASEFEHVYHNLVLFYDRSIRELNRLQEAYPNCLHFASDTETVIIGKLNNTNVYLVLSCTGENCNPLIRLLYTIAHKALEYQIQTTEKLLGFSTEPINKVFRERTSWLNPPTLIPKKKYVRRIKTKTFHIFSCTSLSRSEDRNLEWFKTKSEAIKLGLAPCNTCHP